MKTELYDLIFPLALIVVSAIVAVYVLRRWRGSLGRADGPLKILHVLAVGPRERIALLQVADRQLVIGISPAGITPLAELAQPPRESSASDSSASN